jgi:hypothetical protein
MWCGTCGCDGAGYSDCLKKDINVRKGPKPKPKKGMIKKMKKVSFKDRKGRMKSFTTGEK